MTAIEIARRMAELGQKEDAKKAYLLFLNQSGPDDNPKDQLEAASYVFFAKGDHKVPLITFMTLYNRGFFQAELMKLMTQAFYQPNLRIYQKQYAENCMALSQYPYLFHKEFPDFDDLPVQFFPYDGKKFIAYHKAENRFIPFVDIHDPVVDRYFFRDLENPILTSDLYSQYQMEYLNDTVRKSEWIGRENHIYLHYTNWELFCAYLQLMDLRELLRDEKFVFLVGDEISQYPIDFKERFGIDYSQYSVKPVGIREVNRMIWHTQLAAHNGGDFFNEIFYGHPNLLIFESIMYDKLRDLISYLRGKVKQEVRLTDEIDSTWLNTQIRLRLAQVKDPTEKDYLVAVFMSNPESSRYLDPNSRIAPALFFQPHFPNVRAKFDVKEGDAGIVLTTNQYDEVRRSPMFQQFKYIKTFTPMRRITSSYGATIRFMLNHEKQKEEHAMLSDEFSNRLLNRTFMVDRHDRLFRDSVLVRFEDGKLNPKATFTALAEFLDLPYTESMTYCSGRTGLNPESMKGNDLGFDPAAVYRTYDEYVDDADRALIEYCMRDVYEMYGYDFHYYQGEPVDLQWVAEKLDGITKLNQSILTSTKEAMKYKLTASNKNQLEEVLDQIADQYVEKRREAVLKNRMLIIQTLMRNLQFFSKENHPLYMMKPLKLDPALLEQPLYH